ncbi:hypothetical protein Cpap_1485 [Ruminiclostridium papyrosolvens DSM 2782]|uniref:DUF551 domain-containing protein n=1 Tax=Ruminiclostridium papyrosolvens DSM 2782 TaxID=588581 RepID=F1TEC7_9FIRM|nr:hypothetical protein [Ruminiclostridium papyrosolvens]EGD47093.1 hypothetical protein Cpap_1485 [Ruminiclostridium papyrosolvens DSM 2782]WES36035.1 hypothetical protein P0092_08755 [Ruminiclostridium papyrosolvens DSM 2782]WES36133.1 hypothetical protein P0092_09255 [Ruminiclostridium papyrosolvens DSM 2782]
MSNRFIDTIRENVKYPNSDGVYGNWDILNIGQRKFMIECADYMESMEHVIEQLFKEQQQQRWIPVSERLPGNPNPENGEPKAYLVTINKFAIVPTTLYYMGDGRWVREWDEPSEIYTNILAWRELPEPYKEGNHE